jgi:hypothetical protein
MNGARHRQAVPGNNELRLDMANGQIFVNENSPTSFVHGIYFSFCDFTPGIGVVVWILL